MTESLTHADLAYGDAPDGWTVDRHQTFDESGTILVTAPGGAMDGVVVRPDSQLNYETDDDGNVVRWSTGPAGSGGTPTKDPDDPDVASTVPTPTSETPQPQAASTGRTPEPQAASTEGDTEQAQSMTTTEDVPDEGDEPKGEPKRAKTVSGKGKGDSKAT